MYSGVSEEESTLHLLVRFSDSLRAVGAVVPKHREVIEEHGAVWFGKIGRGPGRSTHASIASQVAAGIPTYLFLAQAKERHLDVYQAPIADISAEQPCQREEHLIPGYYREVGIRDIIGFWSKLTKIESVTDAEVDRWRVRSSKKSLRWTLSWSMSGFFIVESGSATTRS